jgi:hypothetical protein
MHTLDLEARRKEILNLSMPRFQGIIAEAPHIQNRDALHVEVSQCSRTLFTYHRYETDLRDRVNRKAAIPDEYRTWRRLVGLYPLAALPVAYVTDRVYDDFRSWHATAPEDLPLTGRLVTMGPASADADGFNPQNLFRAERLNALGMPRMTAEDGRRLATHFAPVITQDEADDFDHIGTLMWKDGRVHVSVDQATVYYYFSYGLLAGRPVLQINYAFWYSRRDGTNAPWIERGPLDGLTVRISIDHRAHPFMVDLMNNCGCYHFFIPDQTAIEAPREIILEVDSLVPAWLPPGVPEKRIHLRVNSGWHQVQHVGTAPALLTSSQYQLIPYEQLEMLAYDEGQRQSIFDADGIAHNSERIEPLIFFSMGIPAIGSMRQRGHHAIKLVGRAYFDDPLLFEKSFILNWAHFGYASESDPIMK